jgi:Fe2+ or Zn2+ uptake regulation protein
MNTSSTISRNTLTKEAVLHVFQSFSAPITLNDLHQFIKMSLPQTAFSTVFRIMQRLEQDGRVIRMG